MKIDKEEILTKQKLIDIINEHEKRIKSLEDMIVSMNTGQLICNDECDWIDNSNSTDPHMICAKCYKKEPIRPRNTYTTS